MLGVCADHGDWQVPILDTTQLLQSCVQGAVGMLRDRAESCQRNMRRVELLLGLLAQDGEHSSTTFPLPICPYPGLGSSLVPF